MHKYYITFAILTTIVIFSVIAGFMNGGSPFLQKALSYDSQRASQMSSIKYSIDTYYRQNNRLPQTLNQLDTSYLKLNDPQTQKPYDYKITDGTSYSLCTTFSLDTKDPSSPYRQYQYISVGGSTFYHSKGYDCVNLKAPTVYNLPTPTIYRESPLSTFTFYGTVDTVAKSDTQPRIIVKDNTSQMIRIFYLEGAVVVDKNGDTMSYEDFVTGDKVIVDAPQASAGYSAYQAKRIQNLSR